MVAVAPENLGWEEDGTADIGHRHDDSSAGFDVGSDDSYVMDSKRPTPMPTMTPVPTVTSAPVEVSSSGREMVESVEGRNAAELCSMIDAAKMALVSRFKAFLAATFKGVDLKILFENLKFSSVRGEGGEFIEVEGLNDQIVSVEGEDILFSTLCATEGLRVTPRGDSFDMRLSSAVFDQKAVSSVVPSASNLASDPTRVLRVPNSFSATPSSVVSGVQARTAGVQPIVDPEAPTQRITRDDESMGFAT